MHFILFYFIILLYYCYIFYISLGAIFIQQEFIKFIKNNSNNFHIVKENFIFQINPVLLNVLFIKKKNPEIKWFPQSMKRHNCFNIDNNKCFLSSKSAY